PDQRQNVLNRGQRLDTSKPGSGIGLSIVRDIVSAYEGILDLGPSDNGGLRVQVVLPAASSDG
ncbi:MAG: histidine kinase, partial [Rhodospirillaceae bacterium]